MSKKFHVHPAALDAVQYLSFGNYDTERRLDVDDVEIANNIVICANGDESEYLGFRWAWEDCKIQEQEVRSKLNDFRKRKVESFRVSALLGLAVILMKYVA